MTQRRALQRGFTLIELMVALVISSLLVGMILAIFSRMSMSYRGQQQIAGVQQVLAAARATIELDAKQAGLELAQGFRIANDTARHPAVSITANTTATGPDTIGFFYADTTTQAVVTDISQWAASSTLTVDSVTGFAVNSLVVMVNINTSTANGAIAGLGVNDPVITDFDACVLSVASITGSQLRFSTALPWGTTGETHCTNAANPASTVSPTPNQTMIFNFVAHAYRIDPTAANAVLGTLQLSQTGGLLQTAADNWQSLAFGFTDIQVATRFYEPTSLLDTDADGDPLRNWYSSTAQTGLSTIATTVPLVMSISLVARTDRDIEGIATAQTPNLTDGTKPLNNTLGDHASVSLPSVTDPALMGSKIYRYVTFQVDFRNIGVGR
jgi:prepilin-type N-terminal cleavage/methylation domain-containing protein